MNKMLIKLMMVAVFVLSSCGTPQNGSSYIVPQQISDPKISEITPIYETQIERVNNCDGTNPTYNVSYKTIEAQRASFEVSVGAGGLVTGTPIPSVLEVQLEAKITAALAKDYGLTTEKNHDLTLGNAQGTFLEHTITWKVTRVKGLIEVIYGDGIAQVGFEKIANVELYDRTSKSLGCNGQANVQPTAIIATSVPIATNIVNPPTQIQQAMPSFCFGDCWKIDTNANTMTWTGGTDGAEDIWQGTDETLQKIRSGYIAIITTSVPGEIFACVLVVNGQRALSSCGLYQISAGIYQITSKNNSVGGFRWCPAIGYGWRINGGECK